jgi:hypothetical protein
VGSEVRPIGIHPGVTGVIVPEVALPFEEEPLRCRASDAARRRRLVVPKAFVVPERAEHTMATLCWPRYELGIGLGKFRYTRKTWGSLRDNVVGDPLREFANTGATILLHEPWRGGVRAVAV